MPLVPTDFPQRLAARGLNVQVFSDWAACGGSADHRAVVLHHTASSSSARPQDDAAYCHHGTDDAPLYNVLVGRDASVWVLTRNKSNSSGKISSVPLNEAFAGHAGATSAGDRGLRDDTSANDRLFAIAYQNNGTGEPWSSAMVDAGAQVAAVALECLGIPDAGYVTQHRVLTARKIDCCGDACPHDFQPMIAAALDGGAPTPEVPDMWTKHDVIPPGTRDKPGKLTMGLPAGRTGETKYALYVACDPSTGVTLWGQRSFNEGSPQGMWDNGRTWELWLPGRRTVSSTIQASVWQIAFQHYGPAPVEVSLVLSGT